MTATAAQLKAEAEAARTAARSADARAKELAVAARKAEREEHQAKERAESAAHMNRMYEEIGQPLAGLNPAQHGIVYAEAWEQGHASGYSDIENHYGELAEMARKLLDAR